MPYIYRGRGHKLIPVRTENLPEADKIIDRGLVIRIEEDILHLDPSPEDIIIQKEDMKGKTIIVMIVDSPDLEVHSNPLPGGPRLHQHHPVGTMTDALTSGSLVVCKGVS